MTKNRIAIAAIAALSICAGAYGVASASFGRHGHHRGGEIFLLARAGGITHDQMKTAFQNAGLKADFEKVKADRTALLNCFATSSNCTEAANTLVTDRNKLEQDKMNAVVGLFDGLSSTNRANVQSALTQLTSIQQSRKALMKQIFQNSESPTQGSNGDTPTAPATQQ